MMGGRDLRGEVLLGGGVEGVGAVVEVEEEGGGGVTVVVGGATKGEGVVML